MRLPLPQFSSQSRVPGHFAEVVETSTTQFLAQCLEPDELNFPSMPPFGSWVKAIDEDSGNQIYAIVYHATTSPIDSVHRARALGLSLEELREQQPQIFAMLKTEFSAAIVGFKTVQYADGNGKRPRKIGETIYQYLPPRPPQVHQAVLRCEPEDIVQFAENLDFLRSLLDTHNAPVDALIAAAVREVYRVRKADRDWLVQVGRTLSVMLKDDYDRLRVILNQIHP
jgi:hypothetical protein